MNSYGGDDDASSSSSDSDADVVKKFEISVSHSQSFRSQAENVGEQPTLRLSLSQRQKFNRLSDQEEGSTEPSDCEGAPLKHRSSTPKHIIVLCIVTSVGEKVLEVLILEAQYPDYI